MSRIAIIPARGGSKRIPRKNIKLFNGKPVISIPIEIALKSKLFDEVMVSTDDEEISEISLKFGASVPFARSRENSDDHASTVEVLLEVLARYEQTGRTFDEVCCIYPVTPLLTEDLLVRGAHLLAKSDVGGAMPVIKYSHPIQRSLLIQNGCLTYATPEFAHHRSQDLEERYYDAGMFYWIKRSTLMNSRNLVTNGVVPIIVDEINAQDIDNESDWKIAEFKYYFIKKN